MDWNNPPSENLLNQLLQLQREIDCTLSTHAMEQNIDMADASKHNLCAFLALQNYTNPSLESLLIEEGFASVASISPHILYSLNKMIHHLDSSTTDSHPENYIDVQSAQYVQRIRSFELLGKEEFDSPAIMVTLDKSMIGNPEIFTNLLQAGMTIARINCAHDCYDVWVKLIEQLRAAEQNLYHKQPMNRCKIYMDLPGPKIRITPFQQRKIPMRIEEEGKKSERKNSAIIKVRKGDLLRIYKKENFFGKPKSKLEPASIGITFPKALIYVKGGDRVFIDDGNIGGKVIHVTEDYVDVKIILTRRRKEHVKPGKGINFTDSPVYKSIEAITKQDKETLAQIVPIADLIGISYINGRDDLRKIKKLIDQQTKKRIGLIAKIETKSAMLELTNIILEGLNLDLFGVMIARGDLAIEVGYEQLAKAQEGILAICRAAHIPVIWATDVLDRLNKKGIPQRPELTDVYMGLRADCIMLNKGPFVHESIKFINQLEQLNKDPLLNLRNGNISFVQHGFNNANSNIR